MSDNNSIPGSSSAAPAAPATSGTIGVPAPHRYRAAFEKALPLCKELPNDKLLPINVDVAGAVSTGLSTLKRVMHLRDRAGALPEFDIKVFDDLETHTLATGHAHTLYLSASAEPEELRELNEEGLRLRGMLYADAVALSTRKLINGERIGELKANPGFQNLAFDLMGLAQILRSNWDKISSKTAITPDDLDRAELVGDRLMNAISDRAIAPAALADVSAQRQRNFTLFTRAYDQVRRAITFLHWDEGDLDVLAPSLYAGRGNSNIRKKDEQPGPQPTVPGTAPAPGTAPVAGSGSGSSQPFAPVTEPAAAVPAAAKNVAAPKDPFLQ
ncbi:MAG: hypothetical protein ABW061_04350 [Polyangiaceae bacterium]